MASEAAGGTVALIYTAIVHDILWLGFAISAAAFLLLTTTRAVNRLADTVLDLTARVDATTQRADEAVASIRDDVREIADACRRQ